jgi:2-desacetyl-2-hydroxyethyl bacteriochlorophyllide A dehydrogenase
MKYQALLHNGPKDFEFAELDMPSCGDNDVILKNLVASICGSDSDTWLNGGEMHFIPPHVEFGHEVVCEVYEVGKNVTGVKVGDRVAPNPMLVNPNPRKAGWFGGFSEYIYCVNGKYDYNLWKLDDQISDNEAALIEPMAIGFRAADNADVSDETIALILGSGMIGFSVAVRLTDQGVSRKNITFVDRSELRIEKVREQGFNAVSTDIENWQDKVKEYTGEARCVYGSGSKADFIFDCAGSINPDNAEPTLMETGMKMLKYNGKMIAVGVHRRQVNINMQKLVFGLQNIICGSGPRGKPVEYHFKQAIRVLKSRQFDMERLVTHTYKHKEAIEAIKLTCEPSKCFKVLIDYRL